MSKTASMRLTACRAIGEIGVAFLPRRAFAAMSANSKNLRRAEIQNSASTIGPGLRSGRYKRLQPIGLKYSRVTREMSLGMYRVRSREACNSAAGGSVPPNGRSSRT
jgi:hypothetical protein